MIWFLVAMVSLAVVLGLTFVITLGPPWKSADPSMAWLQAGLAWSAILIDLGLVIGTVWDVEIPGWVIALIFLLQDTVFTWRLWVLLQIRRQQAAVDNEN